MYNSFDLSDFFFSFGFAAVLFCCCTVYLKTNSNISKSVEHIHGHKGNVDFDGQNCVCCIHYNPEIAVYS